MNILFFFARWSNSRRWFIMTECESWGRTLLSVCLCILPSMFVSSLPLKWNRHQQKWEKKLSRFTSMIYCSLKETFDWESGTVSALSPLLSIARSFLRFTRVWVMAHPYIATTSLCLLSGSNFQSTLSLVRVEWISPRGQLRLRQTRGPSAVTWSASVIYDPTHWRT